MKKRYMILLLLITVVLLSSCEMHFSDGTTYDVHWWVAALVGVPFLVFGAILFVSDMPKNFWAYCPKCEKRFYVNKRVIGFSSHSRDDFEFVTKCPCCGQKHLCIKSYDQDQ